MAEDISDFARRKGLNRNTIWKWIRNGYKGKKFPATRIGFKYKIETDEGEAFIRDMNNARE